ncbi:HAMP domain-containing sensor histidine kinase [Bdellovibrio sp. BCCA]|uniref:HAMP domain-containing sensor histidine kinase n=1 Tax=Bdellovibrio sp. BCCA TaxID=3136281 RepID=UPI0030F006C4
MRTHHRHRDAYKHHHKKHRLKKKLLFRIFFTFMLTAVLIIGGLGWLVHSLKPDHGFSPVAEKNAVFYLSALQQKLNSSLNEKGIEDLYKDLNLYVRVEGFENLADQKGLPSFSEIEKEDEHYSPKVAVGKHHEYFFAELKGASPRTAWFVSAKEIPRGFAFPFVAVAGFIFLILIMSFLTIRWMMSPIKVLMTGVKRISMGDLKYRIKTRQGGEFQVLGEAFNNMADGLEKMVAAKEQLLRDVSHELRSPLTRVGVAVDLLKDETIKGSIKDDLKKMDELVSEILESYRLREGASSLKKSPTDLTELVTHVVEDYKDSAPGVRLENPENVSIVIDPMQIERVLRNLIENAIKYAKPQSAPIVVTLNLEKGDCVLRVKDDGVGIAEKDLPHIFEPFYRADAARSPGKSGFGLGLAIAKTIVEAHGGHIFATSQIGQGSEFTIHLPLE